jgi:5-methylcytosine-specific restriction endonuclease McrA
MARSYKAKADERKAAVKKWAASNPDKVKRAKAKYRNGNRDALAARNRKYHADNPHIATASQARRRAARRKATPMWVDRNALKSIYEHAAFLSEVTGVKHNVDHVVPLIHPLVCGLHVPWNLEVLTETQNKRKANKFEV